jgi:hypothetical protein
LLCSSTADTYADTNSYSDTYTDPNTDATERSFAI